MDTYPYLFAGYAVIWAAIFAYTISLGRRQRAVERTLAALQEAARQAED